MWILSFYTQNHQIQVAFRHCLKEQNIFFYNGLSWWKTRFHAGENSWELENISVSLFQNCLSVYLSWFVVREACSVAGLKLWAKYSSRPQNPLFDLSTTSLLRIPQAKPYGQNTQHFVSVALRRQTTRLLAFPLVNTTAVDSCTYTHTSIIPLCASLSQYMMTANCTCRLFLSHLNIF